MSTKKTIIKRDRSSTKLDLLNALTPLIDLLESQDEGEAAADLKTASEALMAADPNTPEMMSAIKKIIEAFEGDHELISYTLQRAGEQWTEAEELSQASSRVLSLARRLR